MCFFVSVVCCRVEMSEMVRSLIQRSPTDCGVSSCISYEHTNDAVLSRVSWTYTASVVRERHFKGICYSV